MYPPWHLPQPKPLPYVLVRLVELPCKTLVTYILCSVSFLFSEDVDMRGRWSPRRHDVQLIRVIGKFKKKNAAFPGMNHMHATTAPVWFWFLRTYTHTCKNGTQGFTCQPHTLSALHVAWTYRLKIKQQANSQASLWGLSAFRRLDSVSLQLMYIF